jgi:cysteine-rich repeat protein
MFSRTCGNFTVEGVEQCDDGNFVNLDGCDSRCRYEHLYRLSRLALQPSAAPSWCGSANRLGRAFGTTTGPLNDTIAAQITSNAMLLGLWLLDANVPPVQPDPELSVGVVGLTTDTRSPVTASTRDAWFRVPAAWLFGSGPAYRFSPGRLRDELLRAGPANVSMPFLGTTLNLRAALLRARFGAESSTPNEPPLRIAEGLTTPNELLGSDSEVGLCGEVTVASLARVPIPAFFTSGPGACSDSCAGSRAYVACPGGTVTASCNSMLDLLVSGCAAGGACAFPLVDAIQPDRGAGGGVPRVLVADEETGKVEVAEPNDAYSAYFHFTGLRAHITNNLPD